jgi:DNA-binding MarR family transcriptional regulator
MDAPSEKIVTAWTRLVTVSRLLLERIERDLKAADLPPLSWYDALLEVERAGADGIRPGALQTRLLLPQYGTSRLLERLDAEGLVERRPHPEDGRGQVVRITRAGEALRRRMWAVYAATLRETVGAALSDAEAARLAGLLDRLREVPDARRRS